MMLLMIISDLDDADDGLLVAQLNARMSYA